MKPLLTSETGRALFVGGILAVVLALTSDPSQAQGVPVGTNHPVAAVGAAGLELSFAPKVADGLMLTISGPGFHAKREFPPGAAPSFVLIGDNGPARDGRYKYELRTQPVVDQRIREIAAQTDDDALGQALAREEAELTLVQAGQFEIAGGSIVLAQPAIEAKPAARVHEHGSDSHVHE